MATTTEAQVCNLALLRVGQRELIDDLDENTTAAILCKAIFEPARDELLEGAPWPFANRRALLAEVTLAAGGPAMAEWAHVYALPADCVAPRSIYTGLSVTPHESQIPFALELNSDTGESFWLLTNQPLAQLAYTARVTKPALWSPLFVQALAWRMTLDLILSLAVKPQLARTIEDKANRAIHAALASQFAQAQEPQLPEAEAVRVR